MNKDSFYLEALVICLFPFISNIMSLSLVCASSLVCYAFVGFMDVKTCDFIFFFFSAKTEVNGDFVTVF